MLGLSETLDQLAVATVGIVVVMWSCVDEA